MKIKELVESRLFVEAKNVYEQGYELGYEDGDYGIIRNEKELRDLTPHYSEEQFKSYVDGYKSGLANYENRYSKED